MTHFRLRTQLFIATLLIICGLTGALLLIIRHTVSVETERQVRDGTEASVRAFRRVQRQLEQQLSRPAAMLAELPIIEAQMTTEHAPTIQDASTSWWKLAGSDLFILAMPDRRIVAFHVTKAGWPVEIAERDMKRSVEQGEDVSWWYDNGRLYEVFLRTITRGAGPSAQQLGFLVIGYQVDSTVAEHLAMEANNQIALATGDRLIASTLPPKDEEAMQRWLSKSKLEANPQDQEIALATDHYAFSSVLLHGALPSPVRCYVMMPLGPVNSFMSRLNRTIFVLGASAILFGALLFGFVSRRITRPLENLVSGVRALATGNYTYSITPEGATEVAELSRAFAKMRGELLDSQRQQIDTERIAALGRAASSISHDLRHYLAAVVANAEFLYEAEKLKLNRDDIYGEIKTASEQMTDLLDPLRELSRGEGSIPPRPASIDNTIRHAVDAVRARPEMRNREISIRTSGDMSGTFDPQKIERAFFNLVLNACEASVTTQAEIEIELYSSPTLFEIRVIDHGSGVPSAICHTLFDPFVSFGKSNA